MIDEIKKLRIANVLSNITIVFLFVITGYFVVVYSYKEDIGSIYFSLFNIMNVAQILLFLAIAILNIITQYSLRRNIIFTKSVMSFIVYSVIAMFILLAI